MSVINAINQIPKSENLVYLLKNKTRFDSILSPKNNMNTIGVPVISKANIETNQRAKPEELTKSAKSSPESEKYR